MWYLFPEGYVWFPSPFFGGAGETGDLQTRECLSEDLEAIYRYSMIYIYIYICVCVLGYDHMHAACCKNTYLVQYQIKSRNHYKTEISFIHRAYISAIYLYNSNLGAKANKVSMATNCWPSVRFMVMFYVGEATARHWQLGQSLHLPQSFTCSTTVVDRQTGL